jgi:hypothetical protein
VVIDDMCNTGHDSNDRQCGICLYFSHIRAHEREMIFALSQSDHSCNTRDCDKCQRLIGLLDMRERLAEG